MDLDRIWVWSINKYNINLDSDHIYTRLVIWIRVRTPIPTKVYIRYVYL